MGLRKLLKKLTETFNHQPEKLQKEEENAVIKTQEESLIKQVHDYCSNVLEYLEDNVDSKSAKDVDSESAKDVDSKSATLESKFRLASYNYYVRKIYDKSDMNNLQQAFDDFQKALPKEIKEQIK